MSEPQPWFQRDEYRRDLEEMVGTIIMNAYERYLRTAEIETFHDIAAKEIVETLLPHPEATSLSSQHLGTQK